jgi:hypothetical protein
VPHRSETVAGLAASSRASSAHTSSSRSPVSARAPAASQLWAASGGAAPLAEHAAASEPQSESSESEECALSGAAQGCCDSRLTTGVAASPGCRHAALPAAEVPWLERVATLGMAWAASVPCPLPLLLLLTWAGVCCKAPGSSRRGMEETARARPGVARVKGEGVMGAAGPRPGLGAEAGRPSRERDVLLPPGVQRWLTSGGFPPGSNTSSRGQSPALGHPQQASRDRKLGEARRACHTPEDAGRARLGTAGGMRAAARLAGAAWCSPGEWLSAIASVLSSTAATEGAGESCSRGTRRSWPEPLRAGLELQEPAGQQDET